MSVRRRRHQQTTLPHERRLVRTTGRSGRCPGGGRDARAGRRAGRRIGAQSYRPFGTAADYVVVPAPQAVPLPEGVSFEQGACLGIPGITAHRAVHVAGPVGARTILVQGGGGAVGKCAIALAGHAGATVIATVRSASDQAIATRAGAHHVINRDGLERDAIIESVRLHVPDGIDHVVEVALDRNVWVDEPLLRQEGSIAAYATGDPAPAIPFWPLLFKNVRLYFLGSDDFPTATKVEAARALNETLESGWSGLEIGARFPFEMIAEAHRMLEEGDVSGRIVLSRAGDEF